MFDFGKKKQPKHRGLDKILMGVILGGAIGSVLGIGFAPKKGKDTRKIISQKAGQLFSDAKEAVTETAHKVSGVVSEKAHHLLDDKSSSKQINIQSDKSKSKEIPEEL